MSVIALLLMAIVAFTSPPSAPPSASVPARSAAQRHVVRHLDGALLLLERRDLSGLSAEQRERRAAAIAQLKAYRDAGRYPINRDFAGERVPYFIDSVTDAHCAVGHLMAQTGYGALARRIAAADNHVRVMDLRGDAEVEAWLETHGLTLEEAARIQPAYDGGPGPILPGDPTERVIDKTVLLSGLGVSGVLTLSQHFTNFGRSSRVLPVANLVLGFTTVALAVVADEDVGLRAATAGVGLASAFSGISAIQRGPAASRASASRVQWRIAPSVGRRAVYAGGTWRF